MKKIILGIFGILLGLGVQPAMAYIDPGSSCAIVSATIGFFVAMCIPSNESGLKEDFI